MMGDKNDVSQGTGNKEHTGSRAVKYFMGKIENYFKSEQETNKNVMGTVDIKSNKEVSVKILGEEIYYRKKKWFCTKMMA